MFCNSNSAAYWQQKVGLMQQSLFDFPEIFTAQSPLHILEGDVDLACVHKHQLMDVASDARTLRAARSSQENSGCRTMPRWAQGVRGPDQHCLQF